MPLAAGSSIGPYDIVGLIGTGGMGEVYRARDRKLHRDIALKILPEPFASDAARLMRFEREARALAALNHPHIAQIYGLEESNDARALVMELVEGETLAERTARGALPVPQAVVTARQIADALDAAHERGIIHRDLKPANIKLRPDGTVKVLDFGLAKAFDSRIDEAAESPTMTAAGTRAGVILGTAAYMSPEQARGQAVDKRADIWAFGCVLYEMLTGRAAFAGQTVSDTVARILEGEPDWSRLPERTPAALRRLLRRCLEKDRKHRFRDVGDVRIALEDAVAPAGDRLPDDRGSLWRRSLPWLVGFAGGVVATGLALMLWTAPTRTGGTAPGEGVVRFTIPLVTGEVFPIDAGVPSIVAISPDGEQIVYASRRPDGDRLYLRRRGDLAPTPLPRTEGAFGPFFSPDGQWIGFASGGALKKMPLTGGGPQVLAPVANFRGASWGADDTIVYSPDWESPLFAVSAQGGEPRPLTSLNRDAEELLHFAPHVLPDGKSALVSVRAGRHTDRRVQIDVVDIDTGRRQPLVEGHNPFYLETGHIAFARGDAVFLAAFDLNRRELTGSPLQTLAGVRGEADANFAVSRKGTLAYVSSEGGQARRLVRVDREGRSRPLSDDSGAFLHPRISPDGTRIIVQATGEFFVYDVARGTRVRLRARGSRPIWTPDGRSITFQAQGRLYSAPADNSGEAQLVIEPSDGAMFPLAWSRNGQVLVYSHAVAATGRDLWMLPAGGRPVPYLTTPRDERAAMFSPDGRWVVYAEKETGREEEVYIQPFPQPGGRVVISRGGGVEPVWSPTGREIFYRSVDGRRMLAVDVQTDPTVSVGPERVLFEAPFWLGSSYWSNYDVWPDGNEFLMVTAGDAGPPGVHVVINWIGEVRRRLAAPE
jgi:Tol biopolymer transport system component/tRNA A-37 threonylcarbamoyl transferase component Bud32